MKKSLWVFGNAVQDITVEVDVERLSREVQNVREAVIRLAEQGPEIPHGLRLKTQIGSQRFTMEVKLRDAQRLAGDSHLVESGRTDALDEDILVNQSTRVDRYLLEGGRKYTLEGDILDSEGEFEQPGLFLPCENLSWGGGGANVVTFLRALAPSPSVVPIKYTDVAMSQTLPHLIQKFEAIRREVEEARSEADRTDIDLGRVLKNLYGNNPVRAENITARIAQIAAGYAPERSLEVFLASLPVDSVLYRPETPRFRRNWVFSRFRSTSRQVDNKIILRASPSEMPDEEESRIESLLESHAADVGAILLNSLKDRPLFRAAYTLYKKAYRRDSNVVGILAMTETMQQFTDWLLEDTGQGGTFPPFILVFNEAEASKFASRLGGKSEPFIRDDGFPDIRKFAAMTLTLRSRFNHADVPRIYVTLGSRGSLGVDGSGTIAYVGGFRGATIFDTNACGDAFCAAISLLEWAKRNGYENIAEVDYRKSPAGDASEMAYFMSVATAAAYCKATNRRGRVYAADVKDLLQHTYLPSVILPNVSDLAKLTKDKRPDCVDEEFRLTEPAQAGHPRVREKLNILIS